MPTGLSCVVRGSHSYRVTLAAALVTTVLHSCAAAPIGPAYMAMSKVCAHTSIAYRDERRAPD
eukprot:8425-Heterococcus_DN1.PRE.2